jgi:hypothetical protein
VRMSYWRDLSLVFQLFILCVFCTVISVARIEGLHNWELKCDIHRPHPDTYQIPSPRIRFLYIESVYSNFSIHKISSMHEVFGDDMLVIWDNPRVHRCPFENVKCLSNIAVTKSRKWTTPKLVGAGQEKAIMWAVNHKFEYDFVWIMESDVHFTDINILKSVVYVNASDDFLTQNCVEKCAGTLWSHKKRFLQPWVSMGLEPMCFFGMHNLYRLSVSMVKHLDGMRLRNNGNWLFFEALIPTTVRYFNMTERLWKDLCHLPDTNWTMRYRPCHSNLPVPGIYHPVKFRNGEMIDCVNRSIVE